MDIRKIKKLIELIEETGVNEIEIHEGEESVRIARTGPHTQVVAAPVEHHVVTPTPHAPSPTTPKEPESTLPAGHQVTAPMVGTFYIATSPGASPMVEIGQQVEVGQPLCIIEAMKMFNEIEADKAGRVVARHVENGQAVEFGQALFTIE